MSTRAPGPKTPEKYGGQVGPNYDKWGEQPGYTYDPATDRYKRVGGPSPAQPNQSSAAGLLKLGKGAKTASDLITGGSAASSLPAGYAVASDGTLINASTGAYEVGTAANGGAMMSDGTTVARGGGGGIPIGEPSAAGAFAAAVEAYNAFNDINSENRAQAARRVPLAVADVYLAGIPSLTYGLLGLNPTTKKIADVALAPISKPIEWGMQGFGIANKSTKAYQAQRRKELADREITGYADYDAMTQAQEQEYKEKYKDKIVNDFGARSDIPVDFIGYDTEGKYGEKGRWYNNAYAMSKGDMQHLKAEDVWGSNGVFDTFGSDWLGKFTPDQRRRISERLLEEGVFSSDKGDLVIFGEDQDRAKQIADEIVGNKEEEEDATL